jgi:hypothetical protein
MPVGPLVCVINGNTRGRPWQPAPARAIEFAHEGVPLNVIRRQRGHRNLGVTSIHLQRVAPDEIIQTVYAWRPPVIPARVGLALPRRL